MIERGPLHRVIARRAIFIRDDIQLGAPARIRTNKQRVLLITVHRHSGIAIAYYYYPSPPLYFNSSPS